MSDRLADQSRSASRSVLIDQHVDRHLIDSPIDWQVDQQIDQLFVNRSINRSIFIESLDRSGWAISIAIAIIARGRSVGCDWSSSSRRDWNRDFDRDQPAISTAIASCIAIDRSAITIAIYLPNQQSIGRDGWLEQNLILERLKIQIMPSWKECGWRLVTI